ncbi:class I SAM-dependent methyltransferase [Desulfovibrio sp. UCD-KL4C]|uniref:class I SAM-dependent methyltransferase n=1 Tax=Desulfovibrio sp. UCD-KL4C TaxID=2578120 RepID=UPI0025C5953D|nr:class I SAM-dependent methyltransferase [Desulfovibrio sp. UCD-KL4C]
MDKLKTKVERYWNWRSSSYALDIEKSPETEKAWDTTIKILAKPGQTQEALDIGTGPGQLAFYLAGAGFNVTGMDISPNMISSARKKAKEMDFVINFRTGDAEKLDFADNSFDVVVSRNLIWTLPNPDLALKEWYRVLKPGGRIIVSDGFWCNQTWRRFYQIPMNMLKGMLQINSRISLRFFLHYASMIKHLPLYEGVKENEVQKLMQCAGFSEVFSWDIGQYFPKNPYAFAMSVRPSFFIVYADK